MRNGFKTAVSWHKVFRALLKKNRGTNALRYRPKFAGLGTEIVIPVGVLLYQSLKMIKNKDPPRENPSPRRKEVHSNMPRPRRMRGLQLLDRWGSRPGEPFAGLPKCFEGKGQNEVSGAGQRAPARTARAAQGGSEFGGVNSTQCIWIKDPTLFDGLGPCFGLVQITGSILLGKSWLIKEAELWELYGSNGMASPPHRRSPVENYEQALRRHDAGRAADCCHHRRVREG